jgi:hypothetical protein
MVVLTFRTLSGSITELDCDPTIPISQLRLFLQERLSLPSPNIRLIHGPTILPDSSKISDHAISQSSPVDIEPLPRVRRIARAPPPVSRYLPSGLTIPSPETFDDNVDEINLMLGYQYDRDLIVAALFQASNSLQVAANLVMSHNVRPLPTQPAQPVRDSIPVDIRFTERESIAAIREFVLRGQGYGLLLDQIRDINQQVAREMERDSLPFFAAIGLPVVQEGNAVRPIATLEPEIGEDGFFHVVRLTRLGYASGDVLRAWRECGGNLEAVERRLRGE